MCFTGVKALLTKIYAVCFTDVKSERLVKE